MGSSLKTSCSLLVSLFPVLEGSVISTHLTPLSRALAGGPWYENNNIGVKVICTQLFLEQQQQKRQKISINQKMCILPE